MMTITLLAAGLVLAAAVGIYEAYSNKRGVMGWLVSVVASVVGGVVVGAALPQLVMSVWNPGTGVDPTIGMVVALSSVAIGVLAGSNLALWIVNRFR